jgi:hypothetical protein
MTLFDGFQLPSILPNITRSYIEPRFITSSGKPYQLPPVNPLGIIRFSRLPEEFLNLPVAEIRGVWLPGFLLLATLDRQNRGW